MVSYLSWLVWLPQLPLHRVACSNRRPFLLCRMSVCKVDCNAAGKNAAQKNSAQTDSISDFVLNKESERSALAAWARRGRVGGGAGGARCAHACAVTNWRRPGGRRARATFGACMRVVWCMLAMLSSAVRSR